VAQQDVGTQAVLRVCATAVEAQQALAVAAAERDTTGHGLASKVLRLVVAPFTLDQAAFPFKTGGYPTTVARAWSYLGFLPEGEREVVLKALARDAKDRWPSCRVFVRRLAECSGRGRKAAQVIREVWVDTTPVLGGCGGLCALPYTSSMPVWVFLADVFLLIRKKVERYTYGKEWVLRDGSTARVFDVGGPWARSNGENHDVRQLSAVGIRPGMRLEVIPLPG
jgi:hypothetical protein